MLRHQYFYKKRSGTRAMKKWRLTDSAVQISYPQSQRGALWQLSDLYEPISEGFHLLYISTVTTDQ